MAYSLTLNRPPNENQIITGNSFQLSISIGDSFPLAKGSKDITGLDLEASATDDNDVRFLPDQAFPLTVTDITVPAVFSFSNLPGGRYDVVASIRVGGQSVVNVHVQVPPTVTSLDTTTGPVGGGTSVQITGTGFTGATDVKFGTASASNLSVTDTLITCDSPAGTAGTAVDVTVITPIATSATSAADQFTYTASSSAALEQFEYNDPSVDDTTLSQDFDDDVTAGNLIVLVIPSWRIVSVTSVSDSQGNSYTQATGSPYTGGAGFPYMAIYYAIAKTTGPCTVSYSITGTGGGDGYLNIAIHEFSGVTNVSNFAAASGTGTAASVTVPVTGSNRIVLASYAQGDLLLTSVDPGTDFELLADYRDGLSGGAVGFGTAYTNGVASNQLVKFTLSDSVDWYIAGVMLS